MNGLYIEKHAPMLRIVIPYGVLSSQQLRQLALIAQRYDKGYGHFTTRQNIQFNWLKLEEVPDLLSDLSDVQMHAIQGSGSCIRNITSDPLAGVAVDEVADPRPYCEIVRQWSALHPEFTYLPRKFKIAVSAAEEDRAAIRVHDVGLRLHERDGQLGFEVFVGGGLGRTPHVAYSIREFLPEQHLRSYLEAILRTYNLLGRRDNLYKARIKILIRHVGVEAFTKMVEEEWEQLRDGNLQLSNEQIAAAKSHFQPPSYQQLKDSVETTAQFHGHPLFADWMRRCVLPHQVAGYRAVMISLKPAGEATGDMTWQQMQGVASLADQYSMGEVRATHEQNLLLPNVPHQELFAVWQGLRELGLATANVQTISDIICCPGADYCNLANAHSIPISKQIQLHFSDLQKLYDIGDLTLNISGCMNGCAHHHVGNIGLLGVDKKGKEFFQITLGGIAGNGAQLGENLGPAIASEEVVTAIDRIVQTYLEQRERDERFIDTYQRIGIKPFKENVYVA